MKQIQLFKMLLYVTIIVIILIGVVESKNHEDLLSKDNFLIIAHRGASSVAPEHTLESYKRAKEMNADYIEIDLQMTEDNQLVAMHDETVDRTTNGKGKISTFTLERLQELDAGTWFNEKYPDKAKREYKNAYIPSLKEIFDTFGHDVNYYIETKSPEDDFKMEKSLVKLLDEYGFLKSNVPESKIIIQSFSSKSLKFIQSMNDSIPLIQLQDKKEIDEQTFEEINKYAIGIGPSFKEIDEQYIHKAEDAGLLVHPFIIDDPVELSEAKLWGATGVFTNDLEAAEVVAQ